MLLDKLLNNLVPDSVSGPWTQRFREARKEATFEAQYAELLNLVLDSSFPEDLSKTQDDAPDNAQPATDAATSINKPNLTEPKVPTPAKQAVEDPIKVKEAAVYVLGDLCARQECPSAPASRNVMQDVGEDNSDALPVPPSLRTTVEVVQDMLEKVRPFFSVLPKARTAKIVRNFIDLMADIPNALTIQEQLCLETIRWCRHEKRTFLRHRVETRLALLYHQLGKYTQGMEVIDQLLHDVKRLDDKLLLVEIHYIEAKLFFTVRNMAKAKAALTASRSNANAIHCPPLLQADIDVMAGAIHCEEGDPKTAFSYFFEAFEAFNIADDSRALDALKYMMLAKLMAQRPQDVIQMATQRAYLKYSGRDISAFHKIAISYKEKELAMFTETLAEYYAELSENPIISRHTQKLYQALLEQNILKVLKPYSRIEVQHIAHLMKLPLNQVQAKLSEMILDHQLHATLDQSAGILTLFDEPALPSLYSDSLSVFDNLSDAVDLLHQKARTVV